VKRSARSTKHATGRKQGSEKADPSAFHQNLLGDAVGSA
jgi:hypothetical protein